MRFRPRTWLVLSLLLFAASYWLWMYAETLSATRRAQAAKLAAVPPASSQAPSAAAGPALATVADRHQAAGTKSYRVSNTRLSEAELLRSNHAILLRNALIDTDRPLRLGIPAHLRAKGAPGSYIVQSPSGLDERFRRRLAGEGVEVVAYIPNNAALVEASPEQARRMAADVAFEAVLPYEPYYKLSSDLLPAAVAQDQPGSMALNVTTFPGQRDAALAALQKLGAQLMGEDSSPFGPTLTVMAPPQSLAAIAQLPLAQEIESYAPRRMLNDLTRAALGVATNTLYVTPNYLNLTGSNVTVNMNDTGVDSTHPDLLGRVTGATADQSNGHGTGVAGTIMGSGSQSHLVTQPVPGSIIPGAGFQGKATNATLFVQAVGLGVGSTLADAFQFGGSLLSDAALQYGASTNLGRTNLISNNSWGYDGVMTYDMHAASYDQATRDAQPMTPGEQPLLFVFAAGPEGNGDDTGLTGTAGTILSPGTAKNVITVGAVDSPRFITNDVASNGQTNDTFFGWTDNADLVAWFSGCGNVGVGIESTNGRFKPDVVAPGVFTITCRATNYVDPTNAEYLTTYPFPNQVVLPGQTNDFSLLLPSNAGQLVGIITPNAQSPAPFPNLEILGGTTTPPTAVLGADNFFSLSNGLTAGEWYFGVTTPAGQIQPVAYDLTFYLFETNDLGLFTSNGLGYFQVISNLNSVLKPAGYVYQTGTSEAAGAVSGMLALMQEFLQARLGLTNPSPALLKAMLINGSRSLEQQYDFNPSPEVSANEQGWGQPNLPNSVPASLTNGTPSMALVNQAPQNALATGQSQTYHVFCSDPNVTNYPLRVTLVWTDPPGDPAAGLALVNNLDVLVTDHSFTNVWLGNDFFSGDIFTEPDTGDLPDAINNVQNVYLDCSNEPVVFPLEITVLGTRVNVNAATTVSNEIAQDFALVISSDDPDLKVPLTVTSNAPTSAPPANLVQLENQQSLYGGPLLSAPLLDFVQGGDEQVTIASNAVPLLHQRVGANNPDLYANGPLYSGTPPDTNGNLVQWHFFVFANDDWNATNSPSNVAFTTFLPPDLATQISPRTNGADLDMYVSTNPDLTNLNATVIANSVLDGMASLSRGGTETVILTNSTKDTVYYIGIKSEDQQAADFGFYAVAQETNFSSINPNGSVTARGTGLPVTIPDSGLGPPALVFAFLVNPLNPPMRLRNLTASVGIHHPNPSDLLGTLQHNAVPVVLNNYSGPPGGFTNTYNDLPDNTIVGSFPADGPGTLRNYINTAGAGLWMLTEQDNAVLQGPGQVTSFSVTGSPQPLTYPYQISIGPQQWYFDYVLVPNDATNMTISVAYVAGQGPVDIYLTNVDDVTANSYGVLNINPPGGFLNYSITNQPPLAGGVWFYGIYNENTATAVTLDVDITFGLSQVPNLVQTYTNNTLVPLPTDATTNSTQICITNGQQVVDLSVGLRANDPNLDDLVFQLTSPQGTQIILFENRGGLLATNLGLTLTNAPDDYVYTVFTEDTNLTGTPIKFAPPPYATNIVTPLTNISTSGFGDVLDGTYTTGDLLDGWTVATNEVSVVTEPGYADNGSNFLALASGRIKQTFTTIPGAKYELRYNVRSPGLTDWWPGDANTVDIIGADNGTIPYADVTFDVGEVGRAFTFSGIGVATDTGNEVDFGTSVGNFGTNDVTIDFWIKEIPGATDVYGILEKRVDCGAFQSIWEIQSGPVNFAPAGPGQLAIAIGGEDNGPAGAFVPTHLATHGTINDGIYHHAAVTRNGLTWSIYIDGLLDSSSTASGLEYISNTAEFKAGQSICDGIGGTVPFEGDLDELDLWQRALSPAEIHAIYAAASAGKYSTNSLYPNYQVAIDGISTNIVIISNFAGAWQPETSSFIATNTQTIIELAGNTLGVLLDDIQVVQLPFTNYNNYYLPEEPMSPFIGENPQGCWTLSVWDTRQDSSQLTNGALLGWTLQMTTSSTNANLNVLANGVPFTSNNVPAGGFVYFGVDVPADATFATNTLTATGPTTLFFNQNALPTGTLPGDVSLVALTAAGTGADTLSTQGAPPPLIPGQRYFLGVHNTGAGSESFTLTVSFNLSPTPAITALANGVPLANSVGVAGPMYYSFTVPSDAVLASFQLLSPTSGEADLYARNSLPVPGPFSFDYESLNAGLSDQAIVITTNSVPVPLSVDGVDGILPLPPTTWYLSVYNPTGTSTVGYTVLATYVTDTNLDVIDLNNQPNFTSTNAQPPGYPTNLIYSFTVTNTNAAGLQFFVTNQTANSSLELLVGDGVFPTPQKFVSGSFASTRGSDQTVVIATNAGLTNLTGIWYAVVPNIGGFVSDYSITASVFTNGPVIPTPLIVTASMTSPTNGFTMTWNAVPGQTYQVDVSTNLTHWSAVTNITAISTTASYTDPTPVLSQTSRFFRLQGP